MVGFSKLHTLVNVGLFREGTPQAVPFKKANLIYGENGRGKSTLTSVFRSCAENDAAILAAKKTLDAGGKIRVGMIAGTSPVKFEDGVWSGPIPTTVVFDSEFVERNVYTGQEVRAEQRQSLLEFVLGDTAVALKQEVDRLTSQGIEAAKRKSAAEGVLTAYRGVLSLADFRALPKNENLTDELESAKNRVAVARQQTGILKRPNLSLLDAFAPNLDPIFGILEKSLSGIQQAAEVTVHAHIQSISKSTGFESWIAQGQDYLDTADCPFCGQELDGVELLKAYQSYFNAEYKFLKTEVATLRGLIDRTLSDSVIANVQKIYEANAERVTAWSDQLQIEHAQLDVGALSNILDEIRHELHEKAASKLSAPLDAFGGAAFRSQIKERIKNINANADAYVQAVRVTNEAIAAFKEKLAGTEVAQLESLIKRLELQDARHKPEVLNAFAEFDAADLLRKAIDKQKTDKRGELDALMERTLADYRAVINAWLSKFGASFSIGDMKANYQGGGLPRTEYVLSIRGQPVELGHRGAEGPSFANCLSEGDKRTLAFSFFMARIYQRPDRADLVVVIDDPVSSLDKHRRGKTKSALGKLATDVEQLFVLSHDAYFLRDLAKLFGKIGVETVVNEVAMVQHEYSAIEECDLDAICSSAYYHHYVLVQEFADGTGEATPREVSKVLRVLVEGHLRRRFPKHVNDGVPLGVILTSIKNAPVENPLSHLQAIQHELDDFNDYSSQYHHDSPNADTEAISNTELRVYAKQALSLIHTGSLH